MTSARATPPTSLPELVRHIASDGVPLLDATHVATILEYDGWTDRQAATLGYSDVFQLAEAVYRLATAAPLETAPLDELDPPWYVRAWRAIRLYLRGLSFAAPMLLSSASVLILRYSLWSYVDFDTEIATAIALGTFASFLVAGGFTQSIARRGLFYITQDQYGLARWSSLRLVLAGFGLLAIVALAMILVIFLIPLLPWRMLAVTLLYFIPLTAIWLGVCLLYMLKREPLILGLIAAGIAMVYVLYELAGVPMMVSQVASMVMVAVAAFAAATWLLFHLELHHGSGAPPRAGARQSQVGYALAPFFVYGIAYFALTFVDRIMAWSRPQDFHPYFIWFLGDYELGVDWALWTLILPMGVVEIYIDGLFRRLKQRSERCTIADLGDFRHPFEKEHLRTSLFVLGAGLIGLALILLVMVVLQRFGVIAGHPLADPRTRFVFFLAAPAFSIITTGLANVLVLFCLNDPWPAARACSLAVTANVIIGFLASRLGEYWWAVLGLVAGAVLFALLTLREARRVLSQLDYHLLRGA